MAYKKNEDPIKPVTVLLFLLILAINLVLVINLYIAPAIVETKSITVTDKWMDYGDGEKKFTGFNTIDKIVGCFSNKPCYYFKDETGNIYKMAKYEWRFFGLHIPNYFAAADMFFGIETGKQYEIEMRGIEMTFHSVNVVNIKEAKTRR